MLRRLRDLDRRFGDAYDRRVATPGSARDLDQGLQRLSSPSRQRLNASVLLALSLLLAGMGLLWWALHDDAASGLLLTGLASVGVVLGVFFLLRSRR